MYGLMSQDYLLLRTNKNFKYQKLHISIASEY